MLPEAPTGLQAELGPYVVTLEVGDVAEAAGLVPVVSSDDNYLSHGGGASAAIWRAVGDELRTDLAVLAVVEHGDRPSLAQVLVSRVGPGRVPVFHAITIDFDLGERLAPQDLRMLYTNLLNCADDVGAERIVLPLIGAGAGQVGADGTLNALLDVVLSRSLLSSGQHLSIRVLPQSLNEAQGAFARWYAQHGGVAEERQAVRAPVDDNTGSTGGAVGGWDPEPIAEGAPTPWPALPVEEPPSAIEDRVKWEPASSRLEEGTTHQRSARQPASGPGRWEHLALERDLGPKVVTAAHDLDTSSNAHASWPAMHLWGLLDRNSRRPEDLPPDLRQVLEIAQSARNRMAHGTGEQSTLLPDLLRGIEVLLDPDIAASTIEHSTSVLVGGVRADWAQDGTQHVRLLHDMLRTSLTPEQIEAESERLGALGYRGAASDRMLENCVADDPIDVLQRHFSGSELRRMLEERGIPLRPSDPPRELGRRLLHQLGFPRRDELVDPEMVRTDVQVLASELHILSEAPLTGRIAGISRSLEAVLRTYLRFLTKGLLDTSPDLWLEQRRRKRSRDRLPSSVDRATFGQLAILVGAAGKEIDKSTDPRTQARVHDLSDASGKVTWLPAGIEELRDRRNVWVHGASDESDLALPVPEKRKQAHDFCDLALRILDGLLDGPFPSVIVIEEIGYDTWGRRHVRARTSKGTMESIFTDLHLIPGQTYLMHALTNPMRVDPLLVRQAVTLDEVDL